MDVRMFCVHGCAYVHACALDPMQFSKKIRKKCAHISTGAQVTGVCMGNSTGHQTGFIVGIN